MATPNNLWKLEDAKAKFSEVVRRANASGPQHVTVRGHEEAVVLSARDYARLVPDRDRRPLVDFLESLSLGDLDLTREDDRGRDIDL
jgi:prevent-host-death family protein